MSIFSIFRLSLAGSTLAEHERERILERSRGLNEVTARLVFADDRALACRRPAGQAARTWRDPAAARAGHGRARRTCFGSILCRSRQSLVRPGSPLCTRLLSPRELFYLCLAASKSNKPIEIFHWLCRENSAVFPHLLLVTDELAKVTVIEHFRSTDRQTPGFACGVNDLVAGPGAKVTYVCAQTWGDRVRALQMNTTTVDHDASAMSLNVHLGANYSRFESLSRLIGEGARSDLLAVSVASGDQEFDARTLQDHASPRTTSDLLYKNALNDRARSIFGGLIRVEPHAHFTDAYQKVRNLLLSDEAEADSMPGFEILADNVKCSHGATSGQVDEDEMFYLLTRGIPPALARQLVVTGFLNEVIQRLDRPAISDYLHQLIEAKFVKE